jgi:HrpA-like RNA helicase
MSATLDVNRFTNYFEGGTPHVHIPGRTFPVKDFMLEDVLSVSGYIPPKNKRRWKANRFESENYNRSSSKNDDDDENLEEDGTTKAKTLARKESIEDIVKRIDESDIDYDLIASLVKHLIMNKDPSDDGSILIFLPGVPEISNALDTIKRFTTGLSVTLLPLHGGLQSKEQSRVFPRATKGYTKVILSTNVAETSVTIPDCTIVIDT